MITTKLILFIIFGLVLNKIIKQKNNNLFQILVFGYLFYQICFFIISFPCIILRLKLSVISIIWSCFVVTLCIGFICLNRTQIYKEFVKLYKFINKHKVAFIIILGIIIFQCWFVSINSENCADFTYYIGFISTSIETDSVLQYSPYTGARLTELNFKRIFSTAHVENAVWSQIFKINAIIYMKKIESIIIIIMTNSCYILLAIKIFKKNISKVTCFMIVTLFINLLWFSQGFNTSAFLLFRSFESKSVCANFLIPIAIYQCWDMIDNLEDSKKWIYLFIINFSSGIISPSAMVLIPVITCIAMFSILLSGRNDINKLLVLKRTIICILPCLIMFTLWILQSKFGLTIKI